MLSRRRLLQAALAGGALTSVPCRALGVLGMSGSRHFTAQGGSSDPSLGVIGAYADISFAESDIYSIDMALDDYAIFSGFTNGSTATRHASGWPIGNGGYCRFIPSTAQGGPDETSAGVAFGLASQNIRVMNVRHQQRFGATTPALVHAATMTGAKFALFHFDANPSGGGGDRQRAVYAIQDVTTADNSGNNRADTLTLAPGANTYWCYGDEAYETSHPPLTFYMNGPQGVYWKNTASGDTTFQGLDLIPADEVIEIEYRLQTISQSGYTQGYNGFRIYRSNGQVFERGVPWTIGGEFGLGYYFVDCQMLGCGQWNDGVPGSATFDVGRYLTIARDLNDWLGASEELLEAA
jgi:hypothetical protein